MRLSVVIPTFNRALLLERALTRLIAACDASARPCELIVVDNNSSDDTAAVAARFGDRVRYVFEPRQGLSYARNAGIAAAAADPADDSVVAFTDDDVEVAPDWIAVLAREFDTNPAAVCIGGRVLPKWSVAPPSWLSREHWAPLGLQDHGETRQLFDRDRAFCLIGANVAYRASVFERIGLFSTDVQRIRDSIGSTEDHELLTRLYAAGHQAIYVSDLIVWAEVPPDRLTRQYHRRWHRGHGRFHARMQLPEMERSRGRILGVPVHLFRTAVTDILSWLSLAVSGDPSAAFAREARLWFFSGFVRERCAWLPRR
jgi:glycosyltransferase involved in cell wall biosynthesis